MSPFARQFDEAQYDPEWRSRFIPQDDDILEDDDGDTWEEHMKWECRQGNFI